ncbi:MAG TPA: type II toxin-antitoxin system prevent-host-death family antitoxin [Pyrinomonadaceae bacterium]|nr:type II toxin-antitoxin system prevent-host-death family antitoxin [Pyrinomonadaceae bacterium]
MNVSVYEAKTKLSEMINRALAGEEIVITRSGEATVKLTPVPKTSRWVGMDEGRGSVPDSFFEPLNDDETVKYLAGDAD